MYDMESVVIYSSKLEHELSAESSFVDKMSQDRWNT